MTNTERQRAFRRRNPGYYQRLHAERRAAVRALSAQRVAVEQAPAIVTIPLPTWRLALPAPVETLVFPGLQTIEALRVPASQAR